MNKHKKTKDTAHLRGVAVILTMLLFLTGCTESNNPFSPEKSEPTVTVDDLNISVKYAESYDETTITFSRHWPDDISVGLGKVTTSNDGELMIEYESVNKILAFDEDGYMSSIIEYIDGDETMNMPESIYNSVKESMPSRSASYDPIVKEVMANGVTSIYGKSGDLKFTETYDPENFRIDPAELDSLETWSEGQGTSNSVSTNLNRLSNEGLNYALEGEHYVKYSITQKNNNLEEIRFEYLDDLRTGLNIQTVIYNNEGKVNSVWFNTYESFDGIPIMNSQTQYQYAEIKGAWDVAYRRVMTRNNIKIIKN
jgi:hypothetical protein